MRSSIRGGWLHALLLAFSTPVLAQSVVNSPYNVFGLGTLEQSGLSTFESQGYAAIGARPVDMINIENPAALNSPLGFNHSLDVSMFYAHTNQRATNNSSQGSSGGLRDLNYWFKVSPRMAFAVGMAKFSEGSYDIFDDKSQRSRAEVSDTRHIGKGGTSTIYLGGGYQITKHLNVGLKANLLIGSLQSTELVTFNEVNTGVIVESNRSLATTFFEAGIQYEVPLRPSSSLVFGGVFRTGTNTNFQIDQTIISQSASPDSISDESQDDIYVPQKIGFGIGLQTKSWQVNMDLEREEWSRNADSEGFEYRDRYTGSIGAQFTKDRRSLRLIDRMSFRMGFGMHTNYLSVKGEQNLNQFYTAGIGVPVRNSAILSVNYRLHDSGTTQNGLIAERSSTFSLHLSIRDIWFLRRSFN